MLAVFLGVQNKCHRHDHLLILNIKRPPSIKRPFLKSQIISVSLNCSIRYLY